MLYESIEHADDTVVRFKIKVCLKLKVIHGEFNGFFVMKQIEKP